MSEKVRVDVMRESDAADLAQRVAAQGYSVAVVSGRDDLSLEVDAGAESLAVAARKIWLTLEDWVSGRRLPLVPTRVGEARYLLRPPMA